MTTTMCSKNDADLPQQKELSFSITYTPVFTRIKNYELVVLSPDNKILHAAVLPTGVKKDLKILSPSDKVTIAFIDSTMIGSAAHYEIQAFMNITPLNWEIKQHSPNVTLPVTTGYTVTFTNLPEIPDGYFHFANTVRDRPLGSSYFPADHMVRFGFDKSDNDYVYMLIPSLAKYKFAKLGISDVIDAASLQDAKKVKLSQQATAQPFTILLTGYPEHGNYQKSISLHPNPPLVTYPDFDFLCPQDNFAHYELNFSSQGLANHEYTSFTNTPPTSVTLFNMSDQQITQEDNKITMAFQNMKPVYTELSLRHENMHISITCPPEVNEIDYSGFIKSLRSSIFPKQTSYDFKLEQYGLHSMSPYGYSEYFNYFFAPQLKEKALSEDIWMFVGVP